MNTKHNLFTPIRFFRRRSRKGKLLLFLMSGLFLLLIFFYAWVIVGLPSLDNLEAGLALPSTSIYDRHGRLLYEILPPEQGRNTSVTLDDIPQHCINAIIATEDANYYSHAGVDITGVVRAVWINLQGGEIIAGGSTITQQTARLLLLDPQQQAERTLRRKLREMVLAVQMQSIYSKEHVLELYLNQVYFGNLAYGIDGAARAYFHKSASELSLAECALLAGTIQNAIINDPLTNFAGAKERQGVALRLMVQNGMITQDEADQAAADELQFAAIPFPIDAPHFVMEVWRQLERDYPKELHRGGLEVVTTVDLDWQNSAQEITQQQLFALNNPQDLSVQPANANNAAVVAIDPFTGQVLTMLGSPDYFDESIDGALNAAFSLRQPGSTLKPFTYAEAMNPDAPEPYTAATMILDIETPFITRRLESYTPSNFGLVEHGPVLVREALASSYNIPAVVALDHIGLERFVNFLNNIGLGNLTQNTDVDLSITLGGGEVRLMNLVQAYSIFPNSGFYIEPTFILNITDREGNLIYQWQPPALDNRVLDERIAYIISDILSDNEARIPSFGNNSPLQIGRPVAAKTGTTTDFRDNWVVGYTPNLVVGVWVGNANNTVMRDITGVSGAGPIYNAFMRRVLLGQPELEFTEAPGLIRQEVCELSGLLPTTACQLRKTELFIPGTEPIQFDNFYQAFTIDRETGFLADETTPDERRVEQTYLVLPQEARDWAIRNGIPQPPEAATLILPDAEVGLRLLEPDPYTIFEISPLIPLENQRLRFTVGVPPGTQSVMYILDDAVIGRSEESPWSLWWTLELGEHELLAVATLADGTTETSEPIPFSVAEYEPQRPRTEGD